MTSVGVTIFFPITQWGSMWTLQLQQWIQNQFLCNYKAVDGNDTKISRKHLSHLLMKTLCVLSLKAKQELVNNVIVHCRTRMLPSKHCSAAYQHNYCNGFFQTLRNLLGKPDTGRVTGFPWNLQPHLVKWIMEKSQNFGKHKHADLQPNNIFTGHFKQICTSDLNHVFNQQIYTTPSKYSQVTCTHHLKKYIEISKDQDQK